MTRLLNWFTRYPWRIATSLFLLLHGTIIVFSGLNRPIYGDEGHFIATITQFAENFSCETLRTYNEMSTPLPFMLYALWGKLFGLEAASLRILSLLIGFVTSLVFFSIAKRLLVRFSISIFAYILFLLQPYLIGFTTYVYTDMFAILGLLLAFSGVLKRNDWLLGIGCVIALLSRQYSAFFVMALIMFSIYECMQLQQRDAIRLLSAVILSALPLTVLFMYWRGVTPDNEMRLLYLKAGTSYHLTSLVLYISCITIYLFPAVALQTRVLFSNKKTLIAAILFSLIYFIAPIRASQAAVNVDIETVGLFHRLIRHLFANQMIVDTFFYGCFLIGLIVLIHFMRLLWLNWRNKNNSVENLLILSIICFLIVMPFSYMHWEKYFMLFLPFLLIVLMMPRSSERTSTN